MNNPETLTKELRKHREVGAGGLCLVCAHRWPCESVRAADYIDTQEQRISFLEGMAAGIEPLKRKIDTLTTRLREVEEALRDAPPLIGGLCAVDARRGAG